MMKMVAVADFLTPEEIERAIKLYRAVDRPQYFAGRCRDEIIAPVIDRINEDLGQENDPSYLAYAVEYALSQMK
jgi:hypothetical protein